MTATTVILIGLAALAALVVLMLVRSYNRLVALRHRMVNARHQVDVQLARRHELVPNLVALVKGAMAHEQEVLTALARARGDAVQALERGSASPESAEAETRLSAALGPVVSFVESQPHLMSLDNVRSLQEELSSTENRIAFARQHYNDAATDLNQAGEAFPASVLWRRGAAAPLWEKPAGSERVPDVDLRFGAAAG